MASSPKTNLTAVPGADPSRPSGCRFCWDS